MLTKILKTACRLFLLTMISFLLFFNGSFHHAPTFQEEEAGSRNKDVYQQLQHLKIEMHNGAASDMQRLFPEGFVFMNALYGLAWADLVATLDQPTDEKTTSLLAEAYTEIDYALGSIDSKQGRRIFKEDLPLPYGVFYQGWSNYLRIKYLRILPAGEIKTATLNRFQKEADAIALAFDNTDAPFLESYDRGTWPADNFIAVASLALYDELHQSFRYQTTIKNWLEQVKENRDPTTGLIPHIYYPGRAPQGARGSSLSLMLAVLPEIDALFAEEQYALYEQYFMDQKLGLPGVREYPHGMEGAGDIDSGPVIWGIGGAASVVGQRAALQNGDTSLYLGLRNSLEAFGLAHTIFGKKRYLFGQLPMADAFIAWSNAVEYLPGTAGSRPVPWLIHLVSLLIIFLASWVGWKL